MTLVYPSIQEFLAYDHDLSDLSSLDHYQRFAYRCLDNVKMHKYA